MKRSTRHRFLSHLMAAVLCALTLASSQNVLAENVEEEVFAWRLRAGVAIPTQTVLDNIGNSTSVASVFNTDATYALKEWLRVGVLYEWHEHTINSGGPNSAT